MNKNELNRNEKQTKKPSKLSDSAQFQGLAVVGSTGIEPATPTVSSLRSHSVFSNAFKLVTEWRCSDSHRIHSLYMEAV